MFSISVCVLRNGIGLVIGGLLLIAGISYYCYRRNRRPALSYIPVTETQGAYVPPQPSYPPSNPYGQSYVQATQPYAAGPPQPYTAQTQYRAQQ